MLADLGVAFCNELDIALGRVKAALDAADLAGFSTARQEYVNALNFYQTENSYLTGTWVAWGDACTKLAAEGNGYAEKLNAALRAEAGTSGTYRPDYENPATGLDAVLGSSKWLVIGGAVAAGLYFFAPMLLAGAALKRR